MKQSAARLSALGLIAILLSVLVTPSASAASLGGVLSADTILTAAQSPYSISSPVQIPNGITLKVEAGVTFSGDNLSELFLVAGTVELNGTYENPIRIQGIKSNYIFRTIGESPKVVITNTFFSDIGSLWKNDATMSKAVFTLTNSEVINSKGGVYVWFPKVFTLKNNYLSNSGGFSIGISRCFVGSELNEDIQISGNTFEGKAGSTVLSDGWIVGWVTSCNEKIFVRGNYFKSPVGTAISVPKNYTQPVNVVADRNYWDTTNEVQISSYILDSTDSIEYFHKISVSPSLDTIPTGVPLVSRVLVEQKTAADKKVTLEEQNKANVSALKKTTITCVKGKLTKKVTAIKPKCPAGYKKK